MHNYLSSLSLAITADEVLENYIKTLGGKEKLNNIKNVYIKGILKGDREAGFTMWTSSILSKTETDAGNGFISYNGSNDKGAWTATNQGVTRYFQGEELKENETRKIMNNFALFMITKQEIGTKYIGEKQEKDKKYHILEIKTKDSLPVILFFNENTRLLDKAQIDYVYGWGGFEGSTIIEYIDYKNINGILFPYSFKTISGVESYETIYNEIILNSNIEKSIFYPPKYKSDIVIKDNAGAPSIPILKNPEGIIFLKVKINGSQKEYRFILDTGLNGCIINKNIASELKLNLTGKKKATGIGNKSDFINYAKIEAFHLENNVDIANSFVAVLPYNLNSIDGAFGYNFISQKTVEINNKGGIITLYSPENYTPPKEADKIPMKLIWNQPYIETLINGKNKATLLVDTGAMTGNIGLFSEFADKAGIQTIKQGQIGGIGGAIITKTAQIESMEIDKYLFKKENILVLDKKNMKVDGILGSKFLSRFSSVIFDYYNETLWIVPKQ